MDRNYILLVFLLFLLLFFIIFCSKPSKIERMTLKTDCEVSHQGCLIACKSAKTDEIFLKCYKTCNDNSPVC